MYCLYFVDLHLKSCVPPPLDIPPCFDILDIEIHITGFRGRGIAMEKRRSSRKVISLDAKIISNGISHSGITVNLSEDGIYMITATSEDVINFSNQTRVDLQARLTSEEIVNLSCAVKWFQKKTSPNGTRFKMGMEIMDPPAAYTKFIKSRQ